VYVDRYAEPDKVAAGLGESRDAWPVPFWTIDTAFATMLLLLAAVDEGLGALFFGLFEQEAAVRATFGIPDTAEPIGVVALGYPAAGDRPAGSSTTRARKPAAEVVHRGRW
jgi:nitroreductase